MTQSAFARTTNNAGAAFAAASQTLNYAHHGKVTAAYARSAEWTFMSRTTAKFFISDLLGSRIVTAEGKRLGHVLDIQLTSGPEYKVTALMYGRSGLFHRLHLLNPFRKGNPSLPEPDAIPWDAVVSFEHRIVKLKSGFEIRK
ncbi:MAG: PRC-barrel domain-containing protein [Ktedonobacteraceae bacterium]|nr:PRC-barrel domain-containing protein [Ktedonobacteraceae bacterium]